MQNKKKAMLLVGILGLGLIAVFRISSAATPPQDAVRLEHRITRLEQRLFSIENSLRNVEQQSRMAGSATRGASAEDIARLRLEVQTLLARFAEHECGLAKLDERTLSPVMRAARRKSAGNDPCRLNFDTPLQLR